MPPTPTSAPGASPMQVADKKSILIIEDDVDLQSSLKKYLVRKGFFVDSAYNGSEAVRMISQKDYDIALIDIMLPDINGIEILKKFKQNAIPKTRTIVITGCASLEIAVQSLNLQANAFLLKPVQIADLMKMIDEQFNAQQQEIDDIANEIKRIVDSEVKRKMGELSLQKRP